MSKSKENFYTLKDLQEKNIDPLAIRYLFLQTHYKQEMNFTWEAAEAAQEALARLKKHVISFRESSDKEKNPQLVNKYYYDFQTAIENDLNTAQALGVMWEVMKSELNANEKLNLIYTFDKIFGFGFKNISSDYFTKTIPEEILNLANERVKARSVKNFEKSDALRKRIEQKGYTIEDVSTGYKIGKK